MFTSMRICLARFGAAVTAHTLPTSLVFPIFLGLEKNPHPLRKLNRGPAGPVNETNAAVIRALWIISMLWGIPSLPPYHMQRRRLQQQPHQGGLDLALQGGIQDLELRHRPMAAKTARTLIIHRIPAIPSTLRIRDFCTKPSSAAVVPAELVAAVGTDPIRPSHGPRSLQLPRENGPTPGEACRTSPLELPQDMPIWWRRSLPVPFIMTLQLLQATSTPTMPQAD